VTGEFGTVAGGQNNQAAAKSFAAGANAKATHAGSFVWADQGTDFLGGPDYFSAGDNTFNVRAMGGLFVSPETSLFFGNQVRQMLNLWGASYGIGVQADTLYARTATGFAWYRNGVHQDSQNNNGGGTTLMTLSGQGNLSLAATAGTAVTGISSSSSGNGLVGQADGSNGYGVWARSINGYAGVFDGAVKINLNYPGKAQFEIADSSNTGIPRLRLTQGTQGWDVGIRSGTDGTNALRFYSTAAGRDQMSLHTNGNLTVRVLTITGGADLAEPFEMSNRHIPEGAVVVIDAENPGRLRMSDRAYDTCVAGIVSGAKGVRPGIQMKQEGLLENGQNVALSGRVYVRADASTGPIRPGDLLTTASLPGYAMKVTDPSRAQGAILGKAMTALQDGQGLVLTLVTLQ
jgi:hypothetical protein